MIEGSWIKSNHFLFMHLKRKSGFTGRRSRISRVTLTGIKKKRVSTVGYNSLSTHLKRTSDLNGRGCSILPITSNGNRYCRTSVLGIIFSVLFECISSAILRGEGEGLI